MKRRWNEFPTKLKNAAKRRSSKNFSIEDRVYDMIDEEADSKSSTLSEVVNNILKAHYGIID